MTGRRFMRGAAICAVIVSFTQPNADAQPDRDPMLGQDRWDPGGVHRERWDPKDMPQSQRQRMLRHWTFMNQGVPPEYRGARNPLQQNDENIAAGASLYADKCATCHGNRGFGDGDAGRDLSPSPSLLSHLVRMPVAVDEYLFWSISEGGEPFGSDMPSFKNTLSADAIWKVISYMRVGFPQTIRRE